MTHTLFLLITSTLASTTPHAAEEGAHTHLHVNSKNVTAMKPKEQYYNNNNNIIAPNRKITAERFLFLLTPKASLESCHSSQNSWSQHHFSVQPPLFRGHPHPTPEL